MLGDVSRVQLGSAADVGAVALHDDSELHDPVWSLRRSPVRGRHRRGRRRRLRLAWPAARCGRGGSTGASGACVTGRVAGSIRSFSPGPSASAELASSAPSSPADRRAGPQLRPPAAPAPSARRGAAASRRRPASALAPSPVPQRPRRRRRPRAVRRSRRRREARWGSGCAGGRAVFSSPAHAPLVEVHARRQRFDLERQALRLDARPRDLGDQPLDERVVQRVPLGLRPFALLLALGRVLVQLGLGVQRVRDRIGVEEQLQDRACSSLRIAAQQAVVRVEDRVVLELVAGGRLHRRDLRPACRRSCAADRAATA